MRNFSSTFKRGKDVLEEVEKFCYLGDIISCYVGASEAVNARIGSAWKKFRELSGVLVGKQGLSLKQRRKIYQCCVRPVLLFCCEAWELAVADEARLRGVERRMIKMMCGVRLVDRVSTDVFHDRVGVVLKIKDMIFKVVCGGMVMSCVEKSFHKYVRLWESKQLGKGKGIDQENRGKSA